MSFDIKIANTTGQFDLLQHDIVLDNIGAAVQLTNTTKLEQDILKILFTSKNYFYNQYGTQIEEMIGNPIASNNLQNQLTKQVVDALVYLQFLQTQQAKYQQLSGGEQIVQIQNVQVNYLGDLNQTGTNLTTFSLTIVVLNAAQQTVLVTRELSIV